MKLALYVLGLQLFVFSGCTTTVKKKPFYAPACEKKVYNRGAPPKQFLLDVYDFIVDHKTDALLVGQNNEPLDVYKYLGLDASNPAVLFELLRVSAAMESSWDWTEGRDKSASNYSWYTQEAGIFQTSPNSHVYAPNGKCCARWGYLDTLMGIKPTQNNPENQTWNKFMKDYANKETIIKHHAFMLRHNYRHYGPMINKNLVASNLSNECIGQIETLLKGE